MNLSRRSFLSASVAGMFIPSLWAAEENETTVQFPTPSPAQLAWQDAELGLLYCYELHVFNPERYNQAKARITQLSSDLFNPTRLDTDQWMEAAVAMGAKFAILTASHESGFRLWRSDANPFSLKQAKWENGQRDIVGEFVASCRKYGIQPGIYLGTRWNARLGILDHIVNQGKGGDPEKQKAYARLIEDEFVEICTRYGELFEIWFDGGAYTPDKGGPDILPIFDKHQSNAIFYHNEQRSDVRWGGSESGTVAYPCWATVPWKAHVSHRNDEGWFDTLKHGDPQGAYWSPAMADAPLRNHEWFWEPDDEAKIYPLESLVDMYYKSVGRNATLILGLTPDCAGLVPEADAKRLVEFGRVIQKRFSKPVGSVSGSGESLVLNLDEPRKIDCVSLMEEIQKGERVREYVLEGLVSGDEWKPMGEGTCIGHKRILLVEPVELHKIRLRVTQSTALPFIRKLAAYEPV